MPSSAGDVEVTSPAGEVEGTPPAGEVEVDVAGRGGGGERRRPGRWR